MPTLDAADKTIVKIPDSFCLKPFSLKHKTEVVGMILTEYNALEYKEFVHVPPAVLYSQLRFCSMTNVLIYPGFSS